MSYILIMIIMNSSGSSITSQNIEFQSNSACLEAIQKVVSMEKWFTVKATCVKNT